MPTNQPISTAIVGFGISAKVFHAPFIDSLPQYKLSAFVERNREESQMAYPGTKLYRSFEEMISDPSIELVVITTPNATHFPYASAALKAGKHVVLEKPFTNTIEEGEELVQLAASSDTHLSVYHNRRYVSDFLTIKEILNQGLLGQVHEYVAHYDRYRAEARPQAWREHELPGSGILYDLGPHLIDQALHLFGWPQSITADIRKPRPHARVDDFFELWLDYGHLKVTLHAGMLVREMGPRYMIHGSEGSFIKYGEDPQEAALRAGQKPVGENWGKEEEQFNGLLHTMHNGELIKKHVPTKAGSYALYYENLYRTIREGSPLLEKPEDGLNTIRIIDAAFKSSQKGCKVQLPTPNSQLPTPNS
jgi:scyllo-inositol 2-dehydrogenase (NADP+)